MRKIITKISFTKMFNVFKINDKSMIITQEENELLRNWIMWRLGCDFCIVYPTF